MEDAQPESGTPAGPGEAQVPRDICQLVVIPTEDVLTGSKRIPRTMDQAMEDIIQYIHDKISECESVSHVIVMGTSNDEGSLSSRHPPLCSQSGWRICEHCAPASPTQQRPHIADQSDFCHTDSGSAGRSSRPS